MRLLTNQTAQNSPHVAYRERPAFMLVFVPTLVWFPSLIEELVRVRRSAERAENLFAVWMFPGVYRKVPATTTLNHNYVAHAITHDN